MAIKFGTSGVRGLVEELTDRQCYLYTTAYLQYLLKKEYIKSKSSIAIAGDFRPSTDRIMRAVSRAINDFECEVVNCGKISTPAVSIYGFSRAMPSLMVTGSHVPHDRNGIKFNLPEGEILKDVEVAITEGREKFLEEDYKSELFDDNESFLEEIKLEKESKLAEEEYIQRYLDFFPKNCLRNKKVIVFQHSTVVRDVLSEIFKGLGAEVINEGRSEEFIPIDTEAVRDIDLEQAKKWAQEYSPDIIVSADGDGDRPMVFDEKGNFLRGDLLGVICSIFLQAESLSITASCNTVAEKCKKFKEVRRTKIGSPYVIAGMNQALSAGFKKVASYEANGGYLTGSDFFLNDKKLLALPTRDAVLPMICALVYAIDNNTTISGIVKSLPQIFVFSDSIRPFPTEKSQEIIKEVSNASNQNGIAQKIFKLPAEVEKIDFTDGVRMFLVNGEIVHIRPSGNSPELRAYCEATSFYRAKDLTKIVLDDLQKKFA